MTPVSAFNLAVALSAAAAIAAACVALRLLTAGGALAAFVVGALVFGLGGSVAVAALLAFFLSSSLLSRLGGRSKAAAAEHNAKPGPRDAAQVVANGGVPVLLVVLAALTPAGAEPTGREWTVMLLGALAAVNADTWATEIGGALSRRPRLVTTLRVVPAGTSGAISAAGVAAALCGAAFIALAGWAAWPRASLHLRGGRTPPSFSPSRGPASWLPWRTACSAPRSRRATAAAPVAASPSRRATAARPACGSVACAG